MKNKNIIKYIIILGVFFVALAVVFSFTYANRTVRSTVDYQSAENGTSLAETISDPQIPLAAPQAVEATELVVPLVVTHDHKPATATPAPTPTPAAEQPAPPSPFPEVPTAQEPTPTPDEPTTTPEEPTPALEEPTPASKEPTPTPEAPAPTPEAPTPSPSPAKAQKPADIKDTVSMAKYLFDAATEFWAVEKNFSGTTTRPVSTRVASSIGAGTAVDCPGGDTVRIDKNGVAHDSYAIADHFREYVDMPDLQYFKIYLSEKDYSVNPYGAREEVIGTYYQYGSQRTTFIPENEDEED